MRQRVGGSAKGRGIVGLLDVGTSKSFASSLRLRPAPARPAADRAACASTASVTSGRASLKAGVITDLEAAEQAVRDAVSQAERMAGVELDEVSLSVSCGRLRSHNFAANADVEAGVVTDNDIARVLAGGRAYAEREGRTLVHLNRYGFRLDGSAGVREPRGMAARKLSADLHAVTADDAPLRNLMLVVERCYLSVAGIVATPYASALAATSEEERRLGVTCIDIGGGATTIAVFSEGQFLYTDAIPVGGNHITFDIARNLQTPLAEAERIKALYGTLVGAPSDEHEAFSFPLAGEEDGALAHTTKARLTTVIRPRMVSCWADRGTPRSGQGPELRRRPCRYDGWREPARRHRRVHGQHHGPPGARCAPPAGAGAAAKCFKCRVLDRCRSLHCGFCRSRRRDDDRGQRSYGGRVLRPGGAVAPRGFLMGNERAC